MSKQASFKSLSQRAKSLLAAGENKDVDYKANVKGLHAEDLVAFANSPNGGAILIGVEETETSHGIHKGSPIGCIVDDQSRLQIMGKAIACSPAVQIELFVENTSHKAFFRIEIPSGSHKPHCSGGGTYKIREDGRNVPLLPNVLLKMFLDREGEEFRSRFSLATEGLESIMSDAVASAGDLEHLISSKIEEIGSSLGWAEYKASGAADTIETVQAKVYTLAHEQQKLAKRLKALVGSSDVIDPVKADVEREVLAYLKEQLKGDPAIVEAVRQGKQLSVQLTGDAATELNKGDLDRLFRQAAKEALNDEEAS